MITSFSTSSLAPLLRTAKTHAIAGAAAGVTLGILHGVVSVRSEQLRDGYDIAAEGLTQAGTGTILGLLSGVAASVAGVSVAALAGRGVLAIAAPMVASAVVTGSAHAQVIRLVRPWSEGFVGGLRRAAGSRGRRERVPRLPSP